MKQRMGENITREWKNDVRANEIWDALLLSKESGLQGIAALSNIAESGSSLATMYLGNMYLKGTDGISKNENLGENLLVRSSQNGSIEGSYILAFHYIETNKIDLGMKEYFHLSELNYFPAQFQLGYLYITGDKIERDIDRAIHYFRLASKNGHFPSRHWLCHILMKERSSFFCWILGFTMKVVFTIPFIYTSVTYANSDRMRK